MLLCSEDKDAKHFGMSNTSRKVGGTLNDPGADGRKERNCQPKIRIRFPSMYPQENFFRSNPVLYIGRSDVCRALH